MNRFGFNRKPPSSTTRPTRWQRAGSTLHGRLLRAHEPPDVDVGRMGIGQDKLQVTPLQMAQVAAAVANRRAADGRRT